MSSLVYETPILVLGCGNTLFGNDGFGPAVAQYLNTTCTLPDSVLVLDAGTGIRDLVFDLLLLEKKPEIVIVIDAVTIDGHSNGDVFEIDLSKLPKQKISDFSLHQSPSSNLLSQLKAQGVNVRILAMQTDAIPNEICPGLSSSAQKAVPIAAQWILKTLEARSASNE